MTGYALALVAAFALCGASAGALAVPWASNELLTRAYRRSRDWWQESFERFRGYRGLHPDALPRASAKGSEGALGIWLDDALSQARKGALTFERAEALRSEGIDVGEKPACRSEREQQRRCSFQPRFRHRAALGTCLGAWFACLPLAGMPLYAAALLAVCGAVMAVAVVCDMRARMIPLECCAALLVVGGIYQLAVGGARGLAAGALAAVAVLAVCWVANRIARSLGGAVGFGDVRCMVALALTSGPASLAGAAACYLAASGFSLAGMVSRRLSRHDGIPMAPFLSLWLAFGTVVAG